MSTQQQRKGKKSNSQMQYKVFNLNKEKYYIGHKVSGEIKVYKLIYGEQKLIIVKKLAEIIKKDINNNFPADTKKYVSDYQEGLDKSDKKNTRRLGKILFDYLNGDEK